MKSKLIKLIQGVVSAPVIILLLALPGKVMAQRAPTPQLSPKLQELSTPRSTPNWIYFKDGATVKALSIFKDYKDAFGLALNDEMVPKKTEIDNLGLTHIRYQQFYKNLRVLDGEFAVHQAPDGYVNTANGHLIKGLNLGNNPSITEKQALDAALRFMNAKKYLWQKIAAGKDPKQPKIADEASAFPKGELLYAPNTLEKTAGEPAYKLAWYFKIYTDDPKVTAKSVCIDAVSGQVIHTNDIAMNCFSATGASAFNGNVSFKTWNNGGLYYSQNDCQSTLLNVFNCNGGAAANNWYTDADNTWTDQSGVQAQWGVLQTYNYYSGNHGRQSWDNASSPMTVYNNAYAGSNNACWGCNGNNAIFYAGNTSASTDDWNTDDIMGHEFTHGVTQASAGLNYSYESGALNESFSDIFGEMVESWAEGNCDYLVGADRGAIRSFINPNAYSQPDTYLGNYWYTGTADNGGVHYNSGVQNHWFYLLSEGGSGTNDFGQTYNVTAITRFKARLIAYRALTTYLGSTSTYIDARAASIQAAIDLYGGCSVESIAVGDAWHAVGVESQSSAYAQNACGTYSSGQFVQALSQLTAANGCTTIANSTANTVYFTARDRVILYPGFTAVAGGKFVAYLEPCSSTRYKVKPAEIIKSDPEKGIMPATNIFAAPVEVPITATQKVGVYPNPFTSSFDVSVRSGKDDKVHVVVYNSLGVKVKEKDNVTLSKGMMKMSIDGADLSKGIYMVEITTGTEKIIKKVIKL